MNKYRLRRIGVASNAPPIRPSLSDCIELVLAEVDALAGDVLQAVQASVTTPGTEVDPDDPVPELKQAVLQLLDNAQAVRTYFAAEMRRLAYQSGSQDLAQSPLGRVEDIHVFDLRELEAHIELALARQEVLRAVDDVLPLFDALVSALLGWTSVQSILNPLKPEAFVRSLHQTLTACVPDESARMLLLRPAAVALGTVLRQLYREACDWLRSQGVEPLDYPASKQRNSEASWSTTAETEVERTMLTLDKLRRLLAGESQLGPGGLGVKDFTHTVPASLVALQDLKLVEPMIKRLAERSAQVPGLPPTAETVRIDPAGTRVRSQAQNQQIGRQLGEEVVRMMLDQLVLDERLLAPARFQLRALEPVLLRLAKADPRFFIDREHAARRFLDRVAQRTLAHAGDDEDGVSGFTACLAYAVDSLVQGPGDAASFAAVLEALEQDWAAFEDLRRRQVDEAQDARQHVERRMVLAQRFSEALMERFKDANLAQLVAGFLRGPWSQVLAESHLRNDTATADPRGYLALVDDLVWSVQLPLIQRDYARLIRLIPRLLARLNEGLVLIRYPQEPISIFLDDLSALHEKVLEDHRRAVAAARNAAEEAEQAEQARHAEKTEKAERAQRANAAHAVAPSHLLVGSSVELLLGGIWVRAELTWTSHNRNLFMFVSGAGLAHAMSRRTMDRLESQERIRVVSVFPVIDLELDEATADAPDARPGDGPPG